jgi:hypothetical protein
MVRPTRLIFTGHIAGFGTAAGIRMVVGSWRQSPFGRFADVMIETADGRRTLLAPSEHIAEFVSQTYTFDDIKLGPVSVEQEADRFSVAAPGLAVTAELGGPAPFDWLLRVVPAPLSRAPWWLTAINPFAARLVPGVQTAGSAGHDRREYYGVRRTTRIAAVRGTFGDVDLGGVADIDPPVRFGFSSAPPTPQLVSVTTTIDLPRLP